MKPEGIVKRVIQKRKPQDIVFLLWYGDRKGKDVDLLVILKDGIETNYYEMAEWDIGEASNEDFKRRLELFDPTVTEPLVNGVLLLGNQKKLDYLKKNFLAVHPSDKAIKFLFKRAHEELKNAIVFFEGQLLLFALLDLSFACSYFEFARHYQNTSKIGPISFSELLAQRSGSTLEKVVCVFKQAKLGHKISEAKVYSLIQEVRKMIRGD